jgi:triosephosphate isomerase
MGAMIGTSSKMNLTSTQAAAYLDALVPLVDNIPDRLLFVLLPFTAIWVARDRLEGTRIRWGAQDVHPEDAGAHTGDISAPMLADLGCTYVEVGHHERRLDHGETDESVAAKVDAVQRWGMTSIVCVGEVHRSAYDQVVDVLQGQLGRLTTADARHLVIAYEPAWAIGVGAESARAGWVGQVHTAIRTTLASSTPGGGTVPIIYGGSVAPASARALLEQPCVDGLFVGRQGLDPRALAAIAHTPFDRSPTAGS